MADKTDTLLWPTVALAVTQIVHGGTPVDENHPESESWVGLIGGALLLLLSVVAVVAIIQRKGYGRPLAAWTGLVVAVGFIAYHAVPWSSPMTNPYLGEPVGAPAWISVALAVGAGFWTAYTGRDELRRPAKVPAPA